VVIKPAQYGTDARGQKDEDYGDVRMQGTTPQAGKKLVHGSSFMDLVFLTRFCLWL
jgi:hypothetical protein